MPSVTIYPSISGRAYRASVNETWSNIRSGAGTGSDTNNDNTPGIRVVASGTSGQFNTNLATFHSWNFGANLPSNATITGITQAQWTNSNATGLGNLSVNIYSASLASHTALATSDYTNRGTTAYATAIAQGSMAASDYTTWTWTATGIAAAQAAIAGYLDTSFQTVNDASNSAPSWSSGANSNVDFYFSNAGSHPSSITVTYTVPSGGFFTFF